MKKILFPIYLKLVFFILIIIGLSLSAYVYYAVDLFRNDKVSYVYEAVNDNNETYFNKVKSELNQLTRDLNQVAMTNSDSDFIINILKQNPHLIAYFEILDAKLEKVISFHKKGMYQEVYESQINDNPTKKVIFYKDKVLLFHRDKGKKLGFILKASSILRALESSLYSNDYIVNNNSNDKDLIRILEVIKKENRLAQSFHIDLDEPYIVSARKVSTDLIVVSKTNYYKAVSASAVLRTNSLYFGGLIAGSVIIIILFFSNFFTRPINNLAEIVNQFLSSDFKVRAKIKSSDEIGFLANSFNKMANDINTYMGEMEEKLRLEEELKTANIVQSQFFPKKTYNNGPYTIHGHYQSATECGGDWWGVYETPKSTVLIVADVTGHGTPAALMTAVLHSSLNSLEYLGQNDNEYLTRPDKIMAFLNKSFSKSTQELNSTAFVLCLNHENREVSYTNASHSPPFYLPLHAGNVDKSGIIPLMENIGPRLGENVEQEYKSETVTLQNNDKIVFYTDGLLEGTNLNNKAFGQRNFIKLMLSEQNNSIEVMVGKIIEDFYKYLGEAPLNDDVTLVGLEVNK